MGGNSDFTPANTNPRDLQPNQNEKSPLLSQKRERETPELQLPWLVDQNNPNEFGGGWKQDRSGLSLRTPRTRLIELNYQHELCFI